MNTQQNKFLQITDEHILFVLSNINYNLPINSSIASLWCPSKSFKIDAESISQFLQYFNIDTLIIILITENEKLLKEKPQPFKGIMFININIDGFKELMGNESINEFLCNILFIADNIPWAFIVRAANESESITTISGGSNNKRHLISKLDTRLVFYLLVIFDLNFNLLNSSNGFYTLNKSTILPFIDTSKKGQDRLTSCEGILEIFPHNESLDKTQLVEKNINSDKKNTYKWL